MHILTPRYVPIAAQFSAMTLYPDAGNVAAITPDIHTQIQATDTMDMISILFATHADMNPTADEHPTCHPAKLATHLLYLQ